MLSLMRNLQPIARNCLARDILFYSKKSGCSRPRPNPGLQKIRKLQEHFQKDDGKPIFLKGGSTDQMLYRATWALCFIGLAGQIQLYVHYILY